MPIGTRGVSTMVFRALTLILLLSLSSFAFAQGRSPAVEDFVGIEYEEKQVAPQGTESLFNLEQDINKIKAGKKKPKKTTAVKSPEPQGWGMTAIFGISLALGLPLLIWFMVMSHLKKKASLESASNIEVLEKYRKEREKKVQENIRKVS